MTPPIVSLIIPVYNTEKWLRRCLDSVLAQTFRNFEVILIDDGSSDSSSIMLDEYATRVTYNQEPYFRVFHEQNRGSSLARKFGMNKAKGEWLIFMDSDDDVHPDYIKNLYEAATLNKLHIASCDMQKVANDAEPLPLKYQNLIEATKVLESPELHSLFFSYNFWGFGGKIYHKSVFEGLYFPEYNINEDYVVMAQIFAKQESIAYVREPMYYYRTNPDSQSHIKLTPRIMDEFYNKRWVANFYEGIEKNKSIESKELRNSKDYSKRARDLQAETAIKLCHIIKEEDRAHSYDKQLKELKVFLKENIWQLIYSRNLLLGLKKEAIKITLFY